MKVLHVITYLSDGGGAEKLLEDLLPSIKQKGIEVAVAVLRDIVSNNSRVLRNNGIEIIPIGNGERLYSPLKMIRLISVMRQYDVVHTHLTPPFLMGAFNKLFCKSMFVHTVHSTYSNMRNNALLKYIEKWAMSRYDRVICCSKKAEDTLLQFIGRETSNVCTINNGVNLSKFINATPLTSIVNAANKNIVMVAVLREPKDHRTVIRAASILPTNYHVYFVGYGNLLEDLEKYTGDLKMSERIHFMGKRTDVHKILKAADFVVLASHFEGLSLSSIEGMAAGKPFFASNVPGLKEMVGGYGILFEDGDYKELANRILQLSNDGVKYKEVSLKCRERAMSFDMEAMSSRYIDIYNELCKL